MSHPAINLVCTRCTNSNHAALQRWYNDHAQLLMASPQLQGAQLYRLRETTASMDYFCLYHFAELSDFPAFDAGEVMEKVRDLSNAAPGRSSVEIVKRTQYERLLHRRWASTEHSTETSGRVQASLFATRSDSVEQSMRWLNDAIYQLHTTHPLQSAQAYISNASEPFEIFVLLTSKSTLPHGWHESESSYAARPSIQLAWQAQADRQAQWLR